MNLLRLKTGLRQGDGLSTILFNLVLDKLMKTFWKNNESEVKIGTKHKNLKVKGLAFSDNLTLFAKFKEEAIYQINQIENIDGKTGLQIVICKTLNIIIKNYKMIEVKNVIKSRDL